MKRAALGLAAVGLMASGPPPLAPPAAGHDWIQLMAGGTMTPPSRLHIDLTARTGRIDTVGGAMRYNKQWQDGPLQTRNFVIASATADRIGKLARAVRDQPQPARPRAVCPPDNVSQVVFVLDGRQGGMGGPVCWSRTEGKLMEALTAAGQPGAASTD